MRAKTLAQVSKAKAAGFDLEFMQIKQPNLDAQLAQLRDRLSKEKPELFVIGFGIRGTVEHTELFESLVNICREASSETKIGFNTTLEGTVEVCKRQFGVQ